MKPNYEQFRDIPGTTIFTIELAHQGFELVLGQRGCRCGCGGVGWRHKRKLEELRKMSAAGIIQCLLSPCSLARLAHFRFFEVDTVTHQKPARLAE